ncbi:MAG: nucleoside kinase, partial [Clostridia bacterium]|nr:nucleoside kinase [Clostridia bacterium]
YLWGGVRKGEDRYLFPFSDRADLRIDSIHPYEPCVFRDEAIALLRQLPPGTPYDEDAALLRKKLDVFPAVAPALVPEDSLLHEFLG